MHWRKQDDSLVRLEDGAWLTMADARQQYPQFDITRSWALPDVPVNPGDETLVAYLTRLGFTAEQLQYTRRSWGNATSEALEHISAASALINMEDDSGGSGDFRVLDGYDRIHQHLAEGMDIRFNTVVEAVEWQQGAVTLHTSSGETYQAEHVIITLPLGVLQSDSVRFSPELPATKIEAIRSLRMGPALKLVYRFDEPILPADKMAVYSRHNPPMWWSPSAGHDVDYQVWSAFATGDWARELLALGEDGALKKGVETLKMELDGTIPDPVAAVLVNWVADPYARGGYSVTTPGNVDAHRELAQSVANTLYWAGEATAKVAWTATVHGAYVSGQRAAQEILSGR